MAAGDRCDIFVIGGGPAGATAARLLASWGWSVVLAHRAAPARQGLAESLPSSTRKLLAFLHLLAVVESGHFHPNSGNAGAWAGAPRKTPSSAEGFHVPRPAFDALLRRESAAAGARIVNGVVRRVQLGEPHRIEYATDAGIAACTATMVLDCSGRAGIVARRGFRQADARYRTIAIAAEWDCPEWPVEEQTRTVIESYRCGWAWSVPLSATRRQCTVMIDPSAIDRRERAADAFPPPLSDCSCARPRAHAALSRTYTREIAQAREIASRLSGATQTSAAWACDASIYHAPRAGGSGVLLVGDAASFVEPLSSAGVKKAMTSAWRAAVVANTCLTNANMAGAATDFHVQREHEIYADCQRRSARFFREAADWHTSAFWSSRVETAQTTAPPTGGDTAAIHRAFARLRAAPRLDLRLASALRFTSVPDIEGREVVLREAVVMPDDEQAVRFAAGVDLAALARLAVACDEVPALFSAYTAHVGPVPMDHLLTGLSLLVARQALIHEDAGS
jgi:flavin-dependent dehydrogenase